MKITEVRLTQAQDDLLVVQPISEIFPDGECEDMPENHEFAVKREVPKPLLGDGVIHVRVLSGDSLNQLVPMRR